MPWDPIVLARVRHLHLQARVLTDSLLTGNHRSRRVGQAVEFADYQEYAPGMDLRHLDWKVWGRSDRLVVRRYETETELPCTVVLDLSADLATGDGAVGELPSLERSKAGFAIRLAATLLYWFSRQGEPVGLSLVSGEGVKHREHPPRRGRSHLQQMFLTLASAKPGGRADLEQSLLRVGSRVKRRAWVGVITDGMEEPARWLPALGAFARRGTDLRLMHLFDPRELTLDYESAAIFYSPEGGADLAVDPVGAREDFRAVVAEYLAEVRGGVVGMGGQYLQVSTGDRLEPVFFDVVRGETKPLVVP